MFFDIRKFTHRCVLYFNLKILTIVTLARNGICNQNYTTASYKVGSEDNFGLLIEASPHTKLRITLAQHLFIQLEVAPQVEVEMKGDIKDVKSSFEYLGSRFNKDGKPQQNVKMKVDKRLENLQCNGECFKNNKISKNTALFHLEKKINDNKLICILFYIGV